MLCCLKGKSNVSDTWTRTATSEAAEIREYCCFEGVQLDVKPQGFSVTLVHPGAIQSKSDQDTFFVVQVLT